MATDDQHINFTIYYKIIFAVCCNRWLVCCDKLTLCCHICTCCCVTYTSYVATDASYVNTFILTIATFESYVATDDQHITKMWQHTLNIFWTPKQHYISKIISTKWQKKGTIIATKNDFSLNDNITDTFPQNKDFLSWLIFFQKW